MIELPEALVLAEQISNTLTGKRIVDAVANASPHKFAWYYGDPAEYGLRLTGRHIEGAVAMGGRVRVSAEGMELGFFDGANLRYYAPDDVKPTKHQLLITFDDNSALAATIAMYGGLQCYPAGALDEDGYYMAAANAVSPLSDGFFEVYQALFDAKGLKMSAKAFLATQQRIPGLGNGVLHDILLNSGIHPKTKMNALDNQKRDDLFRAIIGTLSDMTRLVGRDTERDLFGHLGGYKVMLSRNNTTLTCPHCGGRVHKESYMGGSIYYCEICQQV
ncbi:formamidopyrimidine-DNA glycosylase [Clostridia bacterium]|nr:formamidopyrimidine-DNA glycosylase [Clostridia bacterium]